MGQSLTIVLVFVLMFNFLLFVTNEVMADVGTYNDDIFYCNESIFKNLGSNGCQNARTTEVLDDLPQVEGSVNPTTGNLFTDAIATIQKWFQKVPGLNYIYGIITAFHSFLVRMNLPSSFVVAFDMMWYGLSLFLIVAFLIGRN